MKVTTSKTVHIRLTDDEARVFYDMVSNETSLSHLHDTWPDLPADHARTLKEFLQNPRPEWTEEQCRLSEILFTAIPSFDWLRA